jgi:hypothetical protein
MTTFYKILQHVHSGSGEPATSWYHSAYSADEATQMVRELNARNACAINDPSKIAVTYSIGCQYDL